MGTKQEGLVNELPLAAKLDSEVKASWVYWLRSGDYQQYVPEGMDECGLRREDQFCCLGVLADLCVGVRWKSNKYTTECTYHGEHGEHYLPDNLEKELNLPRRVQSMFGEINDDGTSFDEIADIIEEYL